MFASELRQLHETDIEELFRIELEKRGLRTGIDFATQFPIRHTFILDFAFPEQMVAVEVDGEPFHTKPKDRKRDGFKNKILREKGWKVLRFWGKDVRADVAKCVDELFLVLKVQAGCGKENKS